MEAKMSQTLGDIEDLKKVTYTVEMVCLFYANCVLHLQGLISCIQTEKVICKCFIYRIIHDPGDGPRAR